MSTNEPFSTDLKAKYLRNAALEARSLHPDKVPTSLICPISGEFMSNPVITPEGFVYDRSSIVQSLAHKKEDPQSRSFLEIKDLTSFPELVPFIKEFIQRQTQYLELKEQLIQEAREIAHHKPVILNPELFLCPISNRPIQIPVISEHGKLYDRDALKTSLSLKENKDETGEILSMDDVVEFDELLQQIKLYNFYLKRDMHEVAPVSSVNSSSMSFFNSSSWVSPTELTNSLLEMFKSVFSSR